MNSTAIEYLDFTWNPIAMRCTPVSEGCLNCWHLRMCDRMAANPAFPDDVRAAYAGERRPVLVQKRLEEPLHRKKPAVIGVQFMGDLFHEDVDEYFRADLWSIMCGTPQHTYIVLTKRAKAMHDWIVENEMDMPPNIWLGVTAENQRTADERIPVLLQTPAAVRFVSVEQMLGPMQVKRLLPPCGPDADFFRAAGDFFWGMDGKPATYLDWVICGAETGPGARPMELAWARDLRDQCNAAGVPYFFKRAGPGQETPPDLMVREWPKEA